MGVVVTGKRKPVRADARHVVRGQQTRRRILDGARARILREGYESLRLDDLARDAGVTKAAVVKSIGGKAAILLELGDEDRQQRLEVIRNAIALRTGLTRRLGDMIHAMLLLDAARLNIVMAYVGHMWFWAGGDHARAQSMLDETRAELGRLVTCASRTPMHASHLDTVTLRIMAGYSMAVRDLYYRRATLEQAVRLVVDLALA
jgi:AcrR family transcriptional regulator